MVEEMDKGGVDARIDEDKEACRAGRVYQACQIVDVGYQGMFRSPFGVDCTEAGLRRL